MTQVLVDATIWLDQVDITSNTNTVDVSGEMADVDATNFASGGNKERLGGLMDGKLTFAGFFDPERIEPAVHSRLGSGGHVLTATPNGTDGDVAYFARGVVLDLNVGMKIGELGQLSSGVAPSGSEGILRGQLMAPAYTRTAAGTGTAQQLGPTSRLHCVVHVFSVTGPTPSVKVTVQSDDNAAFSDPVDRVVFATASTASVEMKSLAGAITDEWWRVQWEIEGSASFAAVLAV